MSAASSRAPKTFPNRSWRPPPPRPPPGELLGAARGTAIKKRELPPEIDVEGQEPRVGVFVCNCGINIGGVINIPALTEYVATLPGVVLADQNLFTCSADTQDKILAAITENKLNRVVVASCSPRTHMAMFQETIQQVGLNPYLFDMANIRDQDSWVHMHEPEKALEKAKDLIRGAVARVVQLEPLHKQAFPVTKAALVIGGGVAGMEAARSIADMGFQAYLVEQGDKLGGQAWNLVTSSRGYNYRGYLEELIKKVETHPNIELLFNSTVKDTSGFIGNFATLIQTPEGERQLDHGVTIMATGGQPYKPEEYLYGQNPNVLTLFEIDKLIAAKDAKVTGAQQAVFIQCVGSREPQRPYCSRLCCTHSVESAIELKRLKPDMDVFILYRDMRTYGEKELLYKEARELGVIFIRFDLDGKPQVEQTADGKLQLTITDPILDRPVVLKPDLLTLASAVLPNSVEEIGRNLQGAPERRRLPQRGPRQAAPGGSALRRPLPGGPGPLSQAHRRVHRPGQGRRGPGRHLPVQEYRGSGRHRGRGGAGQMRRVPHLRAHLPLQRPGHRLHRGRGLHRPGQVPGLRRLRLGVPGQGHSP